MKVLILATMLLGVMACRSDTPLSHEATGPAVSLVDSVVLSESGAKYIAQLGGVVEDGAGRYLITDMAQSRVVRFAPDGQWLDVIGRKGDGPGEFRGPTQAVPMDHGAFAVGDDQLRRLTVFNAAGDRVRDVAYHGIIRNVVAGGDAIWFGGVEQGSETGITRWDGDSAFRHLFPFPAAYKESPPLRGIFTIVALDAWADTLVAGYSGSNEIVFMDSTGRELDRLDLPAARRKGVTPKGLALVAAPDTPFPDRFSAMSGLFALHRRSSGQIAAVHMDQVLDGNAIESVVWLSLISADLKHACVDGSVPVHGGGHPYVAFAGDTLLVTEQEAQDDPVRTVVHRYLVESEGCGWVELRVE
ncbi:MAG TPA: hypothetical protein VFK36_10245 [Gemmatimonadales bacterium]|nr:hypothetical protein [Gemmatimonadales bacterium]